MAEFVRPTLPELVERIGADLLSRLSQDEVLRRSDLEVQARVQAAALHSLYGFIQHLAQQVLPDTAEAAWLERHATWWGVTRKPASKAAGSVTFATQSGTVVPAGTLLQRPGGGDYLTTVPAVAGGASVEVEVEAVEAGVAGNAEAGSKLMLVSPIAGVSSQATVADPLAGGADIESDDDLRVRLRARIQQPPHGGAAFDYVAWAREVPGVTEAWAYPLRAGPGTVGVTFILGDRPDIVPAAADVALVQAHLDTLRPATAEVIVFAPAPVAVDITLSAAPDTPEVRAAVEAELADFFRREAEPDGVVYLSRLREAISAAAGEAHHALTLPAADVVLAAGEIAVLGAVTWL